MKTGSPCGKSKDQMAIRKHAREPCCVCMRRRFNGSAPAKTTKNICRLLLVQGHLRAASAAAWAAAAGGGGQL